MLCHKLFMSFAFLSLAQLSYAQAVKTDNGCKIKVRSDAVVILVCPSASTADVWRAAGQAACGPKLFCNAWVWDDNAKAPDTAPVTDAEIPKSATTQAIAIWVNDSKSLVTLKKVAFTK